MKPALPKGESDLCSCEAKLRPGLKSDWGRFNYCVFAPPHPPTLNLAIQGVGITATTSADWLLSATALTAVTV